MIDVVWRSHTHNAQNEHCGCGYARLARMEVRQLLNKDTFEETFVDDIPEYYKCPICLLSLKNPYQTPCGHRFCKECILPVLNSRNNLCPIDRNEIDINNTFPDNAVKLQINCLRIRCPMEGCGWEGELSDKTVHLSKCKFMTALCDSCGLVVLRTDMDVHAKNCPQRKVACQYCSEEVAFCNLTQHHDSCLEFPIRCEYQCESSEVFTRRTIEAHLTTCPKFPVSCTMAQYGCDKLVERCSVTQHLKECVPHHAGGMCKDMNELKEEVKDLRSILAAQQEIIHRMETTLYPSAGQFTWRIDNLRGKIKLAQAGDQGGSVVYSPAFYSLEAGYKLSLCIYPAGDNNQGYLSLYFVVMKGQFDEILQWPFQKRVYLSLLNTRGGQSITKDIQPDPRLHYFHRPDNPQNVGYGFPKFIILSRLLTEDSEFIENGALFLRCRIYD